MASIRKRNGLWQVQVRSRHAGSTSKSFHRKTDAERWAIAQEALMQSGQWQEKTPSQYTIGNMLSRYLDIVTPTKRGRGQEERRLHRLLRDKQLMSISLDQAQPCIFANFRDRRIHDGVRACQYDLVLMRHAWNTARIEWGWPLPDNPTADLKATAALGCLALLRCSALRMMSMMLSTSLLASGDAGGLVRLMYRACFSSSMLTSVIVLRFLAHPDRLCLLWLVLVTTPISNK